MSPRPATSLFPGLGRSANVAVAPIVRHRVELDARTSIAPISLRTADALEFHVHPYDDKPAPLLFLPTLPQTVLLLPSTNYPHAARTVHGQTLDATGDPVANVEVTQGAAERAQ